MKNEELEEKLHILVERTGQSAYKQRLFINCIFDYKCRMPDKDYWRYGTIQKFIETENLKSATLSERQKKTAETKEETVKKICMKINESTGKDKSLRLKIFFQAFEHGIRPIKSQKEIIELRIPLLQQNKMKEKRKEITEKYTRDIKLMRLEELNDEIESFSKIYLELYKQESLISEDEAIIRGLESFSKIQKTQKYQDAFLSDFTEEMQIPPISKEYSKSQFFRVSGPVALDIETNKVFKCKEMYVVYNELNDKGGVLLSGIAASGKSVIARMVAHKWFKNGKIVKFFDVKKHVYFDNYVGLRNEINNLNKEFPESLLVIEDTHLNIKLINRVFSKRLSQWPNIKILITARDSLLNHDYHEVNYFKTLHQILLKTIDVVDNIIIMFFKYNGLELTSRLINDLRDISGNNLLVLSFALNSLRNGNGKNINKKTILDEVKKYLDRLADLNTNVSTLYPRILIILSILYRFEM